MYSKKTTIINTTGLHARPAAEFVSAAGGFSSKITINKLDESDNVIKSGQAKSVVNLMSLGLSKGSRIELSAEGEDEQEAVDKLTELIDSGFGDL